MDLLDFAGDEIYFADEPALAGMSFGDALHEYPDSCLIGIAPAEGDPILNPPMDRVIAQTDRLIFISEDDDTIHRAARSESPPREEQIVVGAVTPARPDDTLVLGWNSRASGTFDRARPLRGARVTPYGHRPGTGYRRRSRGRWAPPSQPADDVQTPLTRPTATFSTRRRRRASITSSCCPTPTSSTPSARMPGRW